MTSYASMGAWKAVLDTCRLASVYFNKKNLQGMLARNGHPNVRSSGVETASLISTLETAMLNPLCALQCLYAPSGFGKSCAVAKAAKSLINQNRLRGFCFLFLW